MDGMICHLAALLSSVPPGRGRVAAALVGIEPPLDGQAARTRNAVATLLNLHMGMVHTHLWRLKHLHPEVYEVFAAVRHAQREKRHQAALTRREQHRKMWWRKRRWWGFYLRHHRWPWDMGFE